MATQGNRLCKACADVIGQVRRNDHAAIQAAMKRYCRECAVELYFGSLGTPPTTMHGTGGGQRVIRSTKPFS